MQPLFVFCADLHLEDGAWSTRPGIYGDSYYSLQQIVDYCIENKLPLILGGDVLEKKSNLARPIAMLCGEMSRMQDAKLEVFYIQGNHEYDRNAPWLSVHTWPTHLHAAGVYFDGVFVWGLDWLPRGEIQTALAEKVPENTDILITHQVWKDFMGNVGRTECELTDVHHVQTVLAGDFHVTKTAESVNAQGKPIKMFSPGSTAMQDMGESPDKVFLVVCKNSSGNFEIVAQPLKTRRLISHRVETQDFLDELCAGRLVGEINAAVTAAKENNLPLEITKPLVRVKFDKNLPDAYLRVVTAVGEQAHLFCEAITEKTQARQSVVRDFVKNDLLQAVADLIGDNADSYKIAEALLSSDDPAREMDTLFRKYMSEESDAIIEAGSQELGASPVSGV